MKNRQRSRLRSFSAGKGGSPPQSAPPRRGRLIKPFVALAAIALAGWFLLRFYWPSGTPSMPSTLPGPEASHNHSPHSSPATHEASTDETFRRQVNRGNELLAQGKPAEAVEALTEATRLNPQNEDVHYDLGLALTRQGKLDEAIQQYNEALRIFPNYVEAHNNLGNVLMRLGRADEAISHFETALKIMPDYASAHNNLGTALQKLGRMDDALAHFQKATQVNPDYWEAHFNVATAYLQQRRISDARAELETVLRLRPDFQPARSALAQLNAARP